MAFLSHVWVPGIGPGIIPRRIQSENVERLSQPAYVAASSFDSPRGSTGSVMQPLILGTLLGFFTHFRWIDVRADAFRHLQAL
jgi:hypothetical protein